MAGEPQLEVIVMLEVKVEDKTNRIVLMASAIFAIGQVIKLEIVLPV